MRRVTIKPFTKVEVRWEDAVTLASGQADSPTSAIFGYRPCYRTTIGYWVGYAEHDERKAVVLAMEDDRDAECPLAIGGLSYIPNGMVISVIPLEEPTQRKKRTSRA